MDESDHLRVLVVSDVHGALDNVKTLCETAVKEAWQYDWIWCLGDIADWNWDKATEKEHLKIVDDVLTLLMQSGKPTLFLPGNHDPTSLFQSLPESLARPLPSQSTDMPPASASALNMHRRVVRVHPHLVVAGVGGSCDASQEGKVVWPGVPYEQEAELGADVATALDNSLIEEGDEVILLTHNGPGSLGTAVYNKDPAHPIFAGSASLQQLIEDPLRQQSIVAHLHGHTHFGFGMVQCGRIAVMNPGPLKNGCYGRLSLGRRVRNGTARWMVEEWTWGRVVTQQAVV